MKCKQHNYEATAICINCGIALCEECAELTETKKHYCSSNCADAISLTEKVTKLTLVRTTKGAKAAAYGSYLLAAILIGCSAFLSLGGFSFLVFYMGLTGIGMAIMGYFYQRSSKSKKSDNKAAQ